MNGEKLAGTYRLGDLEVHRMGYGAMRLAGKMVYGPPEDPAEAARVLGAAIEAGIDHIDTSDYYGPHVVNHLIRETLSPYPENLVLVTKVGAKRLPDKSWPPALGREDLISAIDDNLRNLGVERLDVVNLRVGGIEGPKEFPIAEPFSVLAELQAQGKIRHLGLSNITTAQLEEGLGIAPVVCVQNNFGVLNQADGELVDACAAKGIAFVPFFPLGGGFKPLKAAALDRLAAEVSATAHQVALAWLLHRSPNILLIPGTSKLAHLKENIAAGDISLTAEQLTALNG